MNVLWINFNNFSMPQKVVKAILQKLNSKDIVVSALHIDMTSKKLIPALNTVSGIVNKNVYAAIGGKISDAVWESLCVWNVQCIFFRYDIKTDKLEFTR